MLIWLLDGSALLDGDRLIDPTTGTVERLPMSSPLALAPGRAGVVAWVEPGPVGLRVNVRRPGKVFESVDLRTNEDLGGALSEGVRPTLAWVGERLYLHLADFQSGEVRCRWIEGKVVTTPAACVEGGFVSLDGMVEASDGRVVLDSHGEGHPGVDLVRWSGTESIAVPLPFQDLYPFGYLGLFPKHAGDFVILTTCPLGPPRPCLREDGLGFEDGPLTWYRWEVGKTPELLRKDVPMAAVPDPANERLAYLAADQLCFLGRRGKARCQPLITRP